MRLWMEPSSEKCAGKTEFQASSRCGEALYTTYIFFPRSRVVTGVGRDGLTAQPALSPPPPRDKGQKGEEKTVLYVKGVK